MGREVDTSDGWDKLPVGTLARIDATQPDKAGNDQDVVIYVIRVEGEFKAAAGDYMLAGGCYWEEAWLWGEGGTVVDLDSAFYDTQGGDMAQREIEED